jgi:hypothetical protein
MGASKALAALAAVSVAACATDVDSFAARMTSEAEREFSLQYLGLIQAGGVDSAFAQLTPELQTDQARRELEAVVPALSEVRLDSLDLIGVNVNSAPDARQVNLTYEGSAGAGFVVMNVAALYAADGAPQVVGFSARPAAASLETTNAFASAELTPFRIGWLGLMVLIPAACLGAAIAVARSAGMPRRWLWVLACFVAAPVVTLNWTTGAWFVRPVSFVLLGSGAIRGGPAAPWMMSLALPLGAGLSLWRRRKWKGESADLEEAAV